MMYITYVPKKIDHSVAHLNLDICNIIYFAKYWFFYISNSLRDSFEWTSIVITFYVKEGGNMKNKFNN